MELKSLTVNIRPALLFGVLIMATAVTRPVSAESISSHNLLDATPQECAHDVCNHHVCGCASSPLSRAVDGWFGTTAHLEESGIEFEGALNALANLIDDGQGVELFYDMR